MKMEAESRVLIHLSGICLHFDEKRRLNAVSLLKKLAKNRQVLVFSRYDYYDSYVDRKIELLS